MGDGSRESKGEQRRITENNSEAEDTALRNNGEGQGEKTDISPYRVVD